MNSFSGSFIVTIESRARHFMCNLTLYCALFDSPVTLLKIVANGDSHLQFTDKMQFSQIGHRQNVLQLHSSRQLNFPQSNK